MNSISPMNFAVQFGGRLVFGAGSLSALPREAARWSDRAFVVTTRDLTALGLTERVRRLLSEAGMAAAFFEDVRPDPTCVDIDRASALAREVGAGTIIAVGGGSAIDLAKAVAVGARHEGPIWDYVTYTGARARPLSPQLILPVIAVPTVADRTAGFVARGPRGRTEVEGCRDHEGSRAQQHPAVIARMVRKHERGFPVLTATGPQGAACRVTGPRRPESRRGESFV